MVATRQEMRMSDPPTVQPRGDATATPCWRPWSRRQGRRRISMRQSTYGVLITAVRRVPKLGKHERFIDVWSSVNKLWKAELTARVYGARRMPDNSGAIAELLRGDLLAYRLGFSRWRRSLVLGADLPEVLEGVNTAAVVVGPVDPDRVVAHELGGGGDDGGGEVARQNRQRRLGLFGRALANALALGAGAHRSQIRHGVGGALAVLPLDLELLVFLQVEFERRSLRRHNPIVAAGHGFGSF